MFEIMEAAEQEMVPACQWAYLVTVLSDKGSAWYCPSSLTSQPVNVPVHGSHTASRTQGSHFCLMNGHAVSKPESSLRPQLSWQRRSSPRRRQIREQRRYHHMKPCDVAHCLRVEDTSRSLIAALALCGPKGKKHLPLGPWVLEFMDALPGPIGPNASFHPPIFPLTVYQFGAISIAKQSDWLKS